MESGLEYLKRAADKGHIEASYVYGIILLCTGGESTQQGLKLLNAVNSKSKSLRIQECRVRTKAIIRTMWINNYLVRQTNTCCHEQPCIRMERTWDCNEDNDVLLCDACRWDQEVIAFCKMLRGIAA
ncbi:unnamed protein product [Ilex paraguariensis]|uniref:At2g35280-like TPR domain-containing protein n=1 Tax=Ilex paraguariensis TaxID=185542 RepID=A0ABC8QY08_9AQUA